MEASSPSDKPAQPETPLSSLESVDTGQAAKRSRIHLINFCALALLTCFFLPWISLGILGNASGFDLQKGGSTALLVWLLPILCLITLMASTLPQGVYQAGRLAGLTPFAILAYSLFYAGRDLFQVIAPGGWITLGLGFMLLVLCIGRK